MGTGQGGSAPSSDPLPSYQYLALFPKYLITTTKQLELPSRKEERALILFLLQCSGHHPHNLQVLCTGLSAASF